MGRLQAPQGINRSRKGIRALTQDAAETVAAHAQNDPTFPQETMDKAIALWVDGEPESGKRVLYDLFFVYFWSV